MPCGDCCGYTPTCSLSHHLISLTTNWRNSPYMSNKFSHIRQVSAWKLFKAELAFAGITLLSIVEIISSIVIIIFSGPLLLIHIAPSLYLNLWYKDSMISFACALNNLYTNLANPKKCIELL